MPFSVNQILFTCMALSPFVFVFQEGYFKAYHFVYKEEDTIKTWELLTYVPYVMMTVASSWRVAHIVYAQDEFLSFGANVILALVSVSLLYLLYFFIFCTLLYEFSNMFENVESLFQKIMIQHAINRHYSAHIASLVRTFFEKDFLVVPTFSTFKASEDKPRLKGYGAMNGDMLRLVNLLLDNARAKDMHPFIEDAFVRGERINQLAFLLTILKDDEKYAVMTEVHNPDYNAYFNVLGAILDDLTNEKNTYKALQLKTQKTQEELRKQAVLREVEALKKSSESLGFTNHAHIECAHKGENDS